MKHYISPIICSGKLTQHAVLDGDGRHPYELELDSGGYWWGFDASAKSTDQDGITSIFEFEVTAGEAAAIEVEKFDSDGNGETS